MSETLLATYYQEKKERLQKKKKLMKDIKIFLKKKKEKSNNMVVNVTNISQKMKNKSLLSIEKNIVEWESCIIIIKNIWLKINFEAINLNLKN